MKNGGSSTKPEEIELYNKRVSRQTKTWSIDESHFSIYMSTGSHRYMNVSNNYWNIPSIVWRGTGETSFLDGRKQPLTGVQPNWYSYNLL